MSRNDPYHDLDVGQDDDDDDDEESARIAADEPAAGAVKMNVDSEDDRLAIFDMSDDTGMRKSDADAVGNVEDGDKDMKFLGRRKAGKGAEEAPAEGKVDLAVEDNEIDSSLDDEAQADDGQDNGDADGAAGDSAAKKKRGMGVLLRTAAVVAIVIGGSIFGAMKFSGPIQEMISGAGNNAQLIADAGQQAMPAPANAPVDPFAPIAGPDTRTPALGIDPAAGTDPRDLALADPANGAGESLADQLARAAAGDLGDLAPATPPVDEEVLPQVVETGAAGEAGNVEPTTPAEPAYNPEDALAGISETGTPAETAEGSPTKISDMTKKWADEIGAVADVMDAVAAPLQPVQPRPVPAAGSLDAAMAAFLSGYITAEDLEARMSAYTTAATTAEIENRLSDYLQRIENLDGQMNRLDQLETRITAAIEQADRAEQLAIAQNDLVVEVVRMKGKVDMAESLIVDLSRRIASVEQLDPADRVAVDRTLADLTSRLENMARDIGLIARVAIKGESAFAPAPAPTPTASAGDVFAKVPGSNAAPASARPKLDPSMVPANVKKGDVLDGYGVVLDVMPTEHGKMVVTENDSVIIQ